MLLVREVKAKSAVFECEGTPVSGFYRVGAEVVALIHMPSVSRGQLHSFHATRGLHGTTATGHDQGSLLTLVSVGGYG